MKQPTLLRPLVGGALMLLLAVPALAQPRGPRGGNDGPPPRRGDDRGPRRGDNRGPQDKQQLMRLWHDIDRLEASETPLSQTQAKTIVALILPASKQQTLSDEAAKTLNDKIEAVLTDEQRENLRPDRRGGAERGERGDGPPRGERGPRPDGPPPRGEGRGPDEDGPPPRGEGRGPRDGGPDKDGMRPPRPGEAGHDEVRAFMDASNPLYPPTGYASFKSLPEDFQKGVAKRWGESRKTLEALSRKAQGK